MAARRKYTKGRANAQAKSMKMDAAELMTMRISRLKISSRQQLTQSMRRESPEKKTG